MIARVAALTNDPKVAARHYAATLGDAPAGTGVAERAVYSALVAGDYGLAAGVARRAGEEGERSGLVQITLASDAISRGRSELAIKTLQAAELRNFNRMIGGNLEAWAMLDTGEVDAAEARLRQNMTGEPQLDNATMHMLGLLQMSAGRDAEARQTFETLWAAGGRLAVATEADARLMSARGERAGALARLDAFRDAAGANPAHSLLRAQIENGEAVAPTRLTTRQGAALSVYLPAATLLAQTNDGVAAAYFALAIALDPGLHEARLLLAQAHIQGDRPDQALRVLSDVPGASPYYASARSMAASTLLAEERGDEALRVAAEALAAKPDRSLQLQLANLHSALDRHAEAEAIYSDIIVSDEEAGAPDWRAVFLRGTARERQDKWELAEADLQRALELQPDNATILNYLGYSWIDRGLKLEEGLGLIRRAVALEPNSGQIVDSLGWAHYRLGQYDEAVQYLERAVELEPADPVLNDHLGDAYRQTGRKKEAGFQWRRALTLDPDPDDRAAIEQKLKAGLPPPGEPSVR
jgi:tetratricopeptide (TPR) repeat protein